jgi:uncharacterized protein (DUF3820 family)
MMSAAPHRMASIIQEALLARGWSIGEAQQIMARFAAAAPPTRALPERRGSPNKAVAAARGESLPFGKWKGIAIERVPTSYLGWLSGEDWFRTQQGWRWCLSLVEDELEWRRMERDRRGSRSSRG